MMTRRGLLASGVAAAAWGRTALSKAGEAFKVSHSDAEWRKLLTGEQYAVLRQSATERAFTSPLLHEARRGDFRLRRLRSGSLFLDHEIRQRHRLAELLGAAGRGCRHGGGQNPRHGSDRCPLQPLRRPPWPCLQRRSEADGSALLHERRRAELQAGGLRGSNNGPVPARLSRRRADDRQPVHPAGPALRVRAGGPAVFAQRTAHARRHGRDLRRGRARWRRSAAAGPSKPINTGASPRSRFWRCSASRCCSPRCRTE